MASLLGDASDGFVDNYTLWYDCAYELVATIYWSVFIETGGITLVSSVGRLLYVTVDASINLFEITRMGMVSFIYCILKVLLARKVFEAYYF